MALEVRDSTAVRMSSSEIDAWRKIPTAVISDDLNRSGTMHAAIKPLVQSCIFIKQR